MFGKHELKQLAALPGALARYGAAVTVCGISTRGRNTRAAELAGVTVRTMRRACAEIRAAGLRLPKAHPGRPPRTDYRHSRRGRRRRRGDRPAPIDPVLRAAARLGRPEDERQLAGLIRHILTLWPEAEFPHASPDEAAQAIGMYLAAGGQLGPEAETWWRSVARTLPLDRAHTPWRAAASPLHLAPWIAQRRARERAELEERVREERERRAPRGPRPTDDDFARMRARVRGRGG